MIKIEDYNNPYQAILDFEDMLSKFTGAPYCITTDCCTHALEICFIITKTKNCEFTPFTYLSVPMLMHKLNINFSFLTENVKWRKEYNFVNTSIWDSARRFEKNMYKKGQLQCLSFGHTKPLQIGRGGCILTDNYDFYKKASMMRMDGRDIFQYSPWINQKQFQLGFHYYMRPEECIRGINLLNNNEFIEQIESLYNYPDCRNLEITK